MKKLLLSAFTVLASIVSTYAAYTTVTVRDSISSDTYWTCDKQYLLKGYVYVTAGTTLNIAAGTIVKGDKDSKGALIIERGAKIRVMGTATSPVVFTSNEARGTRNFGDWGGIIIAGKAPNNWNSGEATVEGGPRTKYGGSDVNDNSGEIHYCRIEFGGIAFSPNNEVNGLSLYSVGAGTQLDHIQVSYSGDDSYEWFGGTVNSKYLIAYNGWDDDFDVDLGYTGKNQFLVTLRNPYAADNSGSKAFELDSYQSGTKGTSATTGTSDTTNLTKGVFTNVTAIGPVVNPGSTAYDAYYVAGVHMRRGCGVSILNSIFAGWPAGVLVDESSSSYTSTVANIGYGILQFRNNIIAGTTTYTSGVTNRNVVFVKDGARSLTPTTANADTTSSGTDWNALTGYAGPYSWLTSSANKNKVYTYTSDVRLQSPYTLTNPNFQPTSSSPVSFSSTRFPSWSAADVFDVNSPISYDTTSPATYNVPGFAPDFSTTKANDGWFTPTNFVGAFDGRGVSASNWMGGWANFDPNNEDYDRVCYTTAIANVDAPAFNRAVVYPNPASRVATVMVDIKKVGDVKITVLDVAGKEVKVVFNGNNTQTGDAFFEFNTSDLANGLYIMSIVADNAQKTIKFNVAN